MGITDIYHTTTVYGQGPSYKYSVYVWPGSEEGLESGSVIRSGPATLMTSSERPTSMNLRVGGRVHCHETPSVGVTGGYLRTNGSRAVDRLRKGAVGYCIWGSGRIGRAGMDGWILIWMRMQVKTQVWTRT